MDSKFQALVRRIASVLVAVSVAALVVGCNTMHGAGKDVERAGEAVQDAAD